MRLYVFYVSQTALQKAWLVTVSPISAHPRRITAGQPHPAPSGGKAVSGVLFPRRRRGCRWAQARGGKRAAVSVGFGASPRLRPRLYLGLATLAAGWPVPCSGRNS